VYQPPTPVYQPPPPTPASTYQPPPYSTITTPSPAQQPVEKYGDSMKQTTRVDLSQHERQQAEFEEREKRLAERERAISNTGIAAGKF
jgi:hypothetical protein